MSWHTQIGLFLFLLVFCCPLPLRADDDQSTKLLEQDYLNLSLGIGIEFETGDYGTDSTIDTWRVPLLIEWFPHERFNLALEIPYIHQDQSGDTVLMGGRPTPTGNRSGQGPGGRRGSGSGERAESPSGSEDGLGDITLDLGLTLLTDQDRSLGLIGLLYAKLPTADEEKGLGTGEFDWGSGLGLRSRFADWSTYAELMYIIPGTSANYAPDNYWEWLVSLSCRYGDRYQPGVSLSGGTAPFDGGDDPLEAKARLSVFSDEQSSYSFYLSRGLSDASPDWGIGIFGYLDF